MSATDVHSVFTYVLHGNTLCADVQCMSFHTSALVQKREKAAALPEPPLQDRDSFIRMSDM